MVTRIDRIIQLGVEISSARERLRKLEQELAQLVNSSGPQPSIKTTDGLAMISTVASEVHEMVNGFTLGDRIIRTMESDPAKEWRAESIAETLDNAKLDTVRSTLARLCSAGQIVRVGHGTYKARSAPVVEAVPA